MSSPTAMSMGSGDLVAMRVRQSAVKCKPFGVSPFAKLEMRGEVVDFPYHDPAFGCSFRITQHHRDMLDHALLALEPDQRPELRRWRDSLISMGAAPALASPWDAHPARKQRIVVSSSAAEAALTRTFEPATVCVPADSRACMQQHEGISWLLAGCP
mmetsp:Transcript_23041/g.78390  ORF Transcript_23041/g.78390 Transcript_23041/m.78390 type:complete len:157 (+) Transcript_23041:68-538(+)